MKLISFLNQNTPSYGIVSGGNYTGGVAGYYSSTGALNDAHTRGSSVSGSTRVSGAPVRRPAGRELRHAHLRR